MATSSTCPLGLSRVIENVPNEYPALLKRSQSECVAAKSAVNPGTSWEPRPGAPISGNGDRDGSYIAASVVPVACWNTSDQKPFSCVAGTRLPGNPEPGFVV